jgi:hypothetical protein
VIPLSGYRGGEIAQENRHAAMQMVKVIIPESFPEDAALASFKKIARSFRGDCPVAIWVKSTGNKYKLDYDLWVEPGEELYSALRSVYGEDCLRL